MRKDRRGVASTIGTIMALMVFIAFLTLMTNSFVPAWMMDNERDHMNQVSEQFTGLKGDVSDLLTVKMVTKAATLTGANNLPSGDSVGRTTSIMLGSEGVPIFAVATGSQLSYTPGTSTTTPSITARFGTHTGLSLDPFDHRDGGGGCSLEIYTANRYYVQQWIAYENGAIIVAQEGRVSGFDSVITGSPFLSVSLNKNSTNPLLSSVNIEFTQINLVGSAQQVVGTNSLGVNTELVALDTQTYTSEGEKFTLTIKSEYIDAWYNYLKKLVDAAGLNFVSTTYDTVSGTTTTTSNALYSISKNTATDTVIISFNKAVQINYNKANVQMTLSTF